MDSGGAGFTGGEVHNAHAVVGDTRETLEELDVALDGWRAEPGREQQAGREKDAWDAHVDRLRAGVAPDGSLRGGGGAARRGRRGPARRRRAWWEVGVPSYLSGRRSYEENKAAQRRWLG